MNIISNEKAGIMNPLTITNDLSNYLDNDNIKMNEPLKAYTYTKTGGNADVLVSPTSYLEAHQIIGYGKENNVPITFLGNGSNIIIKDGGIRGIVMHFGNMTNISVVDNKVVAQSGAKIIDTSQFALEKELSGLEFACGIPGTVGGAVYMNAGAYGGEISDVLESAVVIDENGEIHLLTKEDLELSYRSSNVAKNNYLVLEVAFSLKKEDDCIIREKMDELTFLRESKQPLEFPSCGSVFKRPSGFYAGKLIQDSGLQGTQIGGVQISLKHAGFMVNVNNGSATDYENLIQHAQATVKGKFGVDLETEVKIIGENM